MTALRTGYLDSSYGQSEHCCSNLLGGDRNFTKAGLNLGLVMYMPSNVIGAVLFLIYATAFSKVSVSPLWMIFSVLLAVVLFVTTPPIPGANILAYIAMISMLNINNEFLMIALMYEIMYGVFAYAANQFFVQIELVGRDRTAGRRGITGLVT